MSWPSSVSTRFEKQLNPAVEQCFSSVEPCVLFSINELLSATSKDVLPALQKCNVTVVAISVVLPEGCRTE